MNRNRKHRVSAWQVLAVFQLFLALILAGTHGTALAEEQALQSLKETGKAFAAVAKGASPAVVYIRVEKSVAGAPMQLPDFFRRFFGEPGGPGQQTPQPQQPPKRMIQGQGSGFIISADGYILTNNHVVGQAEKVLVKLLDGREFTAKIVGTDPPTDVAVIKIDAAKLPVLPLGDSDSIDVGEWVLALGNPFGLSHTLTAGIVSAKGRSHVGIADYEDFIQTDAAINPGNSGGPLIDLEGRVVGINTAIYSQTGGSMGIGFAIPVNMAKNIYTQLIKSGSVSRGYIGAMIQEITPELAKSFKLSDAKGVLITQVTPDSPAEKAGLKHGDVIVKLNGETVADVSPFRNKLSMMQPGTVVKLGIMRDGVAKTVSVTIGKMPAKEDGQTASVQAPGAADTASRLGLTVTTLTAELKERHGLKDDKGALVTAVEPSSPAASAGIRPGMLIVEIDRKAVTGAKDFEKAFANRPDKPVLLLVKDAQGSRYVAIDMKK
jgi:serine protease Do